MGGDGDGGWRARVGVVGSSGDAWDGGGGPGISSFLLSHVILLGPWVWLDETARLC